MRHPKTRTYLAWVWACEEANGLFQFNQDSELDWKNECYPHKTEDGLKKKTDGKNYEKFAAPFNKTATCPCGWKKHKPVKVRIMVIKD